MVNNEVLDQPSDTELVAVTQLVFEAAGLPREFYRQALADKVCGVCNGSGVEWDANDTTPCTNCEGKLAEENT